MLCRVSPKVGIMEVNKELHTVLRGTPADLASLCKVAVTAAVAVAVAVIRVVPYADADIVHAVFRQDLEQILDLEIFVFECNTRLLERDNGRNVHSADKIGVFEVDLFDIDAVILHVRRRGERHGSD